MVKVIDNAHKVRNVNSNIEKSQAIEIKSFLLDEILNMAKIESNKLKSIWRLRSPSFNNLYESSVLII